MIWDILECLNIRYKEYYRLCVPKLMILLIDITLNTYLN